MDQPTHQPAPPKPSRKPRRSRSQRQLTRGRVLLYRLAVFLAYLWLELLWRTCRIRVLNEAALHQAIAEHKAVVPVCWHQHLLLCGRYVLDRTRHAIKPGFMISPSVDGEAPTWLAQRYGAHVVRGSGSYTGVRAVRGVYQAIVKDRISPLITPDGPRGPRFEFKAGALFSAQISGAPVIPMAYAARPAKLLRTWDKFVLPFPFARVVIALGDPIYVARDIPDEDKEKLEADMPRRMHEAYHQAARELRGWR